MDEIERLKLAVNVVAIQRNVAMDNVARLEIEVAVRDRAIASLKQTILELQPRTGEKIDGD